MIIVVFRQSAATARLRALLALSSEYSAVKVRWGQVAVRRTSRSGPESNRSLGLWISGFQAAWEWAYCHPPLLRLQPAILRRRTWWYSQDTLYDLDAIHPRAKLL